MWIVGIVILAIFLVWVFALRPSNFVLIARNVTHIYEYLKRAYGDAFDSPDKLMLATAVIDTFSYLKQRTFFVDNLESIVKNLNMEDHDEEIDTLEKLIISLECLIFEADSRFRATQIGFAVNSQRTAIREAIEQARCASASGRVPGSWRSAADNFMVSPGFESLRERIGVGEKPETLCQT